MPEPRSLPDWFHHSVERAGDHPAILTGTGCLTYAEVDARAGALAHRVRSAGVRPGRVAVVGERGADYHVGYLGALYSGAAVVPLSVDHPPDRVAAVAAMADVHAVL